MKFVFLDFPNFNDPDDPDDPGDEEDTDGADDDPIPDDYHEILLKLSKDWLLMEHKHRISKSGSNSLWDLAIKYLPKLQRAKIDGMVFRPIPKLKTQREKMLNDELPKIPLQIGYLNKQTGEETVVTADKTPKKLYNPREYQKLFEVTTVEVRNVNLILYDQYYDKKKCNVDSGHEIS